MNKIKRLLKAIYNLKLGLVIIGVVLLLMGYLFIKFLYIEFRYDLPTVLSNFKFWFIFISSGFLLSWIISKVIK